MKFCLIYEIQDSGSHILHDGEKHYIFNSVYDALIFRNKYGNEKNYWTHIKNCLIALYEPKDFDEIDEDDAFKIKTP